MTLLSRRRPRAAAAYGLRSAAPRCAPFGLAVLGALVFALAVRADEDAVKIQIQTPRPGETLKNKTDMAPLAGLAIAGERPTNFDVMLVLDVSGSTEYPSGIDVDHDGKL